MTELVDLNSRRAPVVYTVTIAHHYDGTLEFRIEDVGDDERSREAVLHAFRRISGAEDRIEKLEAALQFYADEKPYEPVWDDQFRTWVTDILSDHGKRARKALEGKND
jgi:predicted restriction endonuclease